MSYEVRIKVTDRTMNKATYKYLDRMLRISWRKTKPVMEEAMLDLTMYGHAAVFRDINGDASNVPHGEVFCDLNWQTG